MADNDPRSQQAPTAARTAPTAPAPAGASEPGGIVGPANNDLDAFVERHLRNSALSQNTALYNEAQGHIRALRETLGKVNPPPPPKS